MGTKYAICINQSVVDMVAQKICVNINIERVSGILTDSGLYDDG